LSLFGGWFFWPGFARLTAPAISLALPVRLPLLLAVCLVAAIVLTLLMLGNIIYLHN
jgi:hypothetical protein